MTPIRASLFFAISILALGACASKGETDNNSGNGVDDVKKACDARGVWTRSKETSCFACTSFVASAPCTCNALAGKCHTQAQAQSAESDCSEAVKSCVSSCAA